MNILETLFGKKAKNLATISNEISTQLTLFHHTSIVSEIDLQGNIIYVNDAFCQLSQYKKEELLGKNYTLLKSGLHPDTFYIELRETLSSGKTWKGIFSNRAKDGSIYWVRAVLTPVFNDEKVLSKYIFAMTDVTENKHQQKALEDSQAFLQALEDAQKFLETLNNENPSNIFVIDRHYKCLLLNKPSPKNDGANIEKGDSIFSVLPPEAVDYYKTFYDRAFAGEKFRNEVHFVHNGLDIYSMVDYFPICDANNEITAIAIVSNDITDRRSQELEIKQKNEELLASEEELRQNMEELEATQENLRTQQREIEKNNERLAKQNVVVNALFDANLTKLPLKEAFNKITQACFTAIDVARPSLWMFNADQSIVVCESLYVNGEFIPGYELKASQLPHYFSYLKRAETVAITDVHTHEMTQEVLSFLRTVNIHSALFVPIRVKGKLVGVLCNQDTQVREWTLDEENFSKTLSAMTSMVLEAEERKQSQIQLMEANRELSTREEELRQNMEELEATQEHLRTQQKALEDSQAFLQAINDANPNSIFILDPEYKIITVNHSIAEHYRNLYGIDLTLGFPLLEVMPENMRAHQKDLYDRVLNGETFKDETHYKDEYVESYVITDYFPIRNAQGEITAIGVVSNDITPSKLQELEIKQKNEELLASEEELRQNMEELEATQENLRTQQREIEATNTRLNKQAALINELFEADLTEFTLTEVYNKITQACHEALDVARPSYWSKKSEYVISCESLFVNNEYLPGYDINVEKFPIFFNYLLQSDVVAISDIRTNEYTQEILPLLQAVGIVSALYVPVWVREKIAGFMLIQDTEAREWTLDEQNFGKTLSSMVSTALEAEEQKQSQKALEDSQAFLDSINNANPNSLFAIDKSYNIIMVNQAMIDTYKYAHGIEIAPGMAILNFITAEQRPHMISVYERVFAGEDVRDDFHYNDGVINMYLQIDYFPIRNAQGEITAIGILNNDITPSKLQELEIKQKNEELLASEEELRQNMEELEATQENLRTQQREIEKNNERLAKQNVVVNALFDANLTELPLKEAFNKITQACFTAIDVARPSLWMFNADQSVVVCESLYVNGEFIPGYELKASQLPHYFSYLKRAETVAITDVYTHEMTQEVLSFLRTVNIHSALFVPIRVKGKLVGVLCNQDTQVREWTLDEENFSKTLSAMASMVLEAEERKQSQIQLMEANRELSTREEELRQNMEELEATQEQLRKQNTEIEKQARSSKIQNAILSEMAGKAYGKDLDLKEIYKDVTLKLSKGLGIDRASIWLYNDRKTAIVCTDLYEQKEKKHSSGLSLFQSDFPNYFEALYREDIIVASNAMTHPDTSEFTEVYLKPLGIHSLLEVPIIVNGQVVGVICSETLKPRLWHLEDENFARSIAAVITLVMEAEEKARVEKELHVIQERLQLAISGSQDGLWDWNIQAGTIYYSPKWKEILGYEDHEMSNTIENLWDSIRPEQVSTVREVLQDYLIGKLAKYELEFQMKHKDGSYRWISARGSALFDGNGQPTRILGFHTDITRKKEAEQKELLNEKMATLGTLMAGVAHEINTPLGAIRASSDNMSNFIHSFVHEMPLIVRGFNAEEETAFMAMLEKAMEPKPQLTTREERQLKKTVAETLESMSVADAKNIADNLVKIGIETPSLYQKVFEHPEYKDIIKVITHIGKVFSSIDTIHLAVNKSQKMIMALKNYSNSKDFDKPVISDLAKSMDMVLDLYQNALKHGVDVIKHYDIVPSVFCFEDELNQVFTNIVWNAIQAMNGNGKLEINIIPEEQHLNIYVEDNGPGIPKEIQQKIFEPFFTTKKKGEGTGLGLDICRKIVAKHYGELTVESEPGKTVFKISIPMQSPLQDQKDLVQLELN